MSKTNIPCCASIQAVEHAIGRGDRIAADSGVRGIDRLARDASHRFDMPETREADIVPECTRKAITQRRRNCRARCFRETGLKNYLNSGSGSCMISMGVFFPAVGDGPLPHHHFAEICRKEEAPLLLSRHTSKR